MCIRLGFHLRSCPFLFTSPPVPPPGSRPSSFCSSSCNTFLLKPPLAFGAWAYLCVMTETCQRSRTLLPLHPPPIRTLTLRAPSKCPVSSPHANCQRGKVQESKAKCSASFGLCPHHSSFIVVPASTASCPTRVWWPRFPPVREERGAFGCVWAPCVTTPAQEARE